MKKIIKIIFFTFAFTSATFFTSCSDAISETEETQNEKDSSVLFEKDDTGLGISRYCFGGRIGRDGNSPSSSYGNRHRRNG